MTKEAKLGHGGRVRRERIALLAVNGLCVSVKVSFNLRAPPPPPLQSFLLPVYQLGDCLPGIPSSYPGSRPMRGIRCQPKIRSSILSFPLPGLQTVPSWRRIKENEATFVILIQKVIFWQIRLFIAGRQGSRFSRLAARMCGYTGGREETAPSCRISNSLAPAPGLAQARAGSPLLAPSSGTSPTLPSWGQLKGQSFKT